MSRYLTRSFQAAVDCLMLSVAFWLAFGLRFELSIPAVYQQVAISSWPYVIAIEYLVMVVVGVTRHSWRYVSLRETSRIGLALALSTSVLLALRFSVEHLPAALRFAGLPLGVIGSNLLLCFVGLVAARALRRVWGEARERKHRRTGIARTRVLLIGAGQAGVLVAREIAGRPDLALQPVGFLDDDLAKVGLHISGLPVLGTTARIADIAQRKRVQKVLITIANAAGADIRRITMRCREAGLETRIIPGIYELVGDRVNLSRLREVAIEDLLGREPVQLDEQQVAESIRGATIMVTGAGGSIGSELCRQVCRFGPGRLILVERFENALFEIHRELTSTFPGVAVVPRVADVTDEKRMDALFAQWRPAAVFHAAAHKHVPLMEENPGESIKNNVGGTRLMADLADRYQVERFVMVSTDKAVNPTSVMGATKRVAEIHVQSLAGRSRTRYVTVRFGNVLGSNGSVIPIFKEQIARGGPVTITHPDMQRYFMTIPEASQLVLQAGAMGQGGEIFILDMGQPVKIVDLACDLITLSGLRPHVDIAIEFTGIRPGEKLFEELATDAEHADKTRHPKIFIGRTKPGNPAAIDTLLAVASKGSAQDIRSALAAVVPEYSVNHTPNEASEAAQPASTTGAETQRSSRRSTAHPVPSAVVP